MLAMVSQLPIEALSNHVLEAPGVQEWFEGATEVGNPDALLLAFKIQEKIGADAKAFSKLLPSPYNQSKLFSADHMSAISNCLKVILTYIYIYIFPVITVENGRILIRIYN